MGLRKRAELMKQGDPERGVRIPEDLGARSGVIWAAIPEDLGALGEQRRLGPDRSEATSLGQAVG